MAGRKIVGVFAVAIGLSACLIAGADEAKELTTAEMLGIKPRPAVCSGCAAEEAALEDAAAAFIAAYDAYQDAENALMECELGGQSSTKSADLGKSILVKKD